MMRETVPVRQRRFLTASCVVLLFVSFTTALELPGQQGPDVQNGITYSVQSQLVQIYLTVAEDGRRVSGLTASDFRLSEDGVPKNISTLDSETVPLQVALLLDTSASMQAALPYVQEAAAYFVDSLRPIDRVALVPFSTDVRLIPQLTDDHGPILQAIRSVEARGSTKLYDALLFAMKYLSDKNGRKAIVSFSDGEDTGQSSSLQVVLNAAAYYGYPIYTVGAGAGLRRDSLMRILRQLAEINSGRTFFEADPSALRDVFEEVSAELRSAYVLNYYTQVPFDGRWHEIQIALSNPRYKIRSRRGFYARGGREAGLFSEFQNSTKGGSGPSLGPRLPQLQAATAHAAQMELLRSPVEIRPMDSRDLRASLPAAQAIRPKGIERPEFKVETRLVELPVLVESASGKELVQLSEKDFRVYEDDSLRKIALFVRDAENQDLPQVRDAAVSKLLETRNVRAAPKLDQEGLKLGRFYLVFDDLMTDLSSFSLAKRESEKIIREYHRPVRPLSLHFTSQSSADISPDQDAETMIRRLQSATWHGASELTSTGNIMTVYEAFLVDRGDSEAEQLAELRYASSRSMTYRNSLGIVQGNFEGDTETVRNGVEETARHLVGLNRAQAARALDGLRAVVSAAAVEPGDYPKGIIFVSSGFMLGRSSIRGDVSQMLDGIIAIARRQGIRIYAVDVAGLAVHEAIGIQDSGAFLVSNPQLQSILLRHAEDWQHSKDSVLNQISVETGGKFVNNTNDIAAASGVALRAVGQLYYLGYLSEQPADGRYHRIRVTASLPGVRIHTREGYHAWPADVVENETDRGAAAEEQWDLLLQHAAQAGRSGDYSGMAADLDKLVRKFPGNAALWFNLGAARLRLGDRSHAVTALQRAFVLSPEDKRTGSTLALALVAAGYRDAATEVMELMVQRHPGDLEVIMQMGRILETDGRTEKAYRMYRRALDCTMLPPLDLYILLARNALLLGRNIEADLFLRDYRARGGDPSAIKMVSDANSTN